MDERREDDTGPRERPPPEWVCPRCHARAPAPDEPRAIVYCESASCVQDRVARVTPDALAEGDGDPFLGATIGGRFVVLGRLGAGSMGTVYRARQEGMARDVALKILRSDRTLDAQSKARFAREARALSLLTSPHTVTVFDFGEIDDAVKLDDGEGAGGSLYLAMELLDGESLGHRLRRTKRLRFDEAGRIARHALRSLAEAHGKGVIHRDLKPDNLFLVKPPPGSQDETCKLLDFGIAKIVEGSAADVDSLETQAGTVFGTPRYMSPEQAQGKALDGRSDLYSMGVLLYHMLVGRAPFADADAVVVMARHIKSAPVAPVDAAPNAGIPRPLSDLVLRMLAKDPDDRPQRADALLEELDAVLRRARDEAPVEPAATSGELSALSRDDLSGPVQEASRGKRAGLRRFGWIAMGAALGAAVASAVVAGAMGADAAPFERARTGLAAPALAAADAASRAPSPSPTLSALPPEAPPSAASSAAAKTAPPLGAPRRPTPRKTYTRFE